MREDRGQLGLLLKSQRPTGVRAHEEIQERKEQAVDVSTYLILGQEGSISQPRFCE